MKSRKVAPIDSVTFTSKELCERYRCAQVTLRRLEEREGFPHGEKVGRDIIYLKASVYEWERIHKPSLQVHPPMSDDDAEWDRRRRRYLLEKEEREANNRNKKPTPPQKGQRRRGPELSVR